MANTSRQAHQKSDLSQYMDLSNPAMGLSPESIAPDGFPIVGMGASAGGIAAVTAFFVGLDRHNQPDVSYILVQHLPAEGALSLLTRIQEATHLPVCEITDGMTIQPNRVYISPAQWHVALLHGSLHLLEPPTIRLQSLPIDYFFQSLAEDQGRFATGIIFSGTGSDGTLGLRAIKGKGGMVMAQDPDSAAYDGMPQNAIATGLVDVVLTPAAMGNELRHYLHNSFGLLPPATQSSSVAATTALRSICTILQDHTGHDFSNYKRSGLIRRIERRMTVQQIDTIGRYSKFLQQSPTEIATLFHDLLLGMTSFFRDPEAFAALGDAVTDLILAETLSGAPFRVWVPGCASGEEAYSIAILLLELLESKPCSRCLQIFATDIDGQAIALGRAGLYPADSLAAIAPERLARYFTKTANGHQYRVSKTIREPIVFAEHDLLRDPPFCRLDLISCRNLLINLTANAQKKTISFFHHLLPPGGILFLGKAETVGEGNKLFSAIDRQHRIYRRTEMPGNPLGNGLGRGAHKFLTASFSQAKQAPSAKPTWRQLTEQALLKQACSMAILIDGDGTILYLHGRAGVFLELPPGDSGFTTIGKMVRNGLQPALDLTFASVVATKQTCRHPGLTISTNDRVRHVNLTIHPVMNTTAGANWQSPPTYLIVFEEIPAEAASTRQYLAAPEEQWLPTATYELENANAAFRLAYERIQSVNEDLQSSNEELETSQEELQAVNKELAMVNAELHTKVTDLTSTNHDLSRLLNLTGIAAFFVDHDLKILRFTPSVTRIINLIQQDIGRPIGHITTNLPKYTALTSDIQAVIDYREGREQEVQTASGKLYKMQILPYRDQTMTNEGAVVAFNAISANTIPMAAAGGDQA